MTDEQTQELIGLIYEAAFAPSCWYQVLGRLADAVHGTGVAFIRADRVTGRGSIMHDRADPRMFDDLMTTFMSRNPWLQRVAEPPGTVLADWQIVPKRELWQTEFYNDFMRPNDINAMLSVVAWTEGTEVAALNIARPARAGEYDSSATELVSRFTPHIGRACAVGARLNQEWAARQSTQHAATLADQAVIVLDKTGRILSATEPAERILSRGDGPIAIAGKLTAPGPARSKLESVIARAADGADGGAVGVPRVSGGTPYALFVTPAPRRVINMAPSHAAVVVLLSDPSAGAAPAISALQSIFGMTRAEATVAAELADGHSVAEAARTLSVSVHTVRQHLAVAMRKTGTRRQAELVRLLVRLPPAMDADHRPAREVSSVSNTLGYNSR